MKKSDVKDQVRALLSSGRSKSETFAMLTGQGVKDNQLAIFIASFPDPQLFEKHKGKVKTLIALMLIQSVIGFLIGFGIGTTIGPIAKFMVGLFVAAIPLAFAWGFYKNIASAYGVYIILSIIQFPKQLTGIATSPVATSIGFFITFAIVIFVWYVRSKVFPDFSFIAPRKQNGRYVFSS